MLFKPKRVKDKIVAAKNDPVGAYNVAIAIKGRWPTGEPAILNDSFYSYMYARYVLKRRWPEAEPTIQKSNTFWRWYLDYFNHPAVRRRNR